MPTPSASTPLTMRALAQELGVSKSAVSAAFTGRGTLTESTRQAILLAARERGFEPNALAQSLSNGRLNNTVGIFALWLDFGVGTQKLQLIQGILNQKGFTVPIYGLGLCDFHSHETQTAAIAAIRRQRPRALVCATGGLFPQAIEELRKFQGEGGTLVCYDSPCDIPCDQVIFDREDNTYRSTRHLLELGHRDVAFGHHAFIDRENVRLRGYFRALSEFGIKPREEWLLEGKQPVDYAAGGLELAHQFLQLTQRPTAFTIVNDYAASVALAQLHREGISCPENISICGHDDYAMSRHGLVPLTTASHPASAIADQVTQFLLDRIQQNYDGAPRQTVIQGELFARSSSRPL